MMMVFVNDDHEYNRCFAVLLPKETGMGGCRVQKVRGEGQKKSGRLQKGHVFSEVTDNDDGI